MLPTQKFGLVYPMDACGNAVIVTVVVADAAAQPPPAAMSLEIVYVPGVLTARLISPVEALIDNPLGEAVNTPPLAPVPKTGEGFVPLLQ